MFPWVDFEPLLSLNGAVNLLRRDGPLLKSIAQEAGPRPAQFVAHFTQPLELQETLVRNGQEPSSSW